MRKLMISIFSFFLCSSLALAQDDCMDFFPTDEGTSLVNKSYDASGKLLSTMVYKVNKTYNYPSGPNTTIGFELTDANGNLADSGNLSAQCDDGTFYLGVANKGISYATMNMLGRDTELISDFLDYPNVFNEDYPFDSPFKMDEAEMTFKSKADNKMSIKARLYNRKYEKNESITVPGGTFDAAKVTFEYEVRQNKTTTQYKGVEWYALGAGVIRSETYDNKGNLLSHTELASIMKP